MKEDFSFTDIENENTLYTLGHIAQFTGLSDRTLRNHLTNGILQGEKINGIWHFTAEQVESFIAHPFIRPSILAKNNAVVYDFLLDKKKTREECCIILDIPHSDRKKITQFFCYEINNGDYHNLKFSLDAPLNACVRIILKGDRKQVLQLVNKYYETSHNH